MTIWTVSRTTETLLLVVFLQLAVHADPLKLNARFRQPTSNSSAATVAYREMQWEGQRTAIVVCDMWDQHWCKGATARVTEMAPRMNEFLKAARARGVLVVHAPSGTMKYYADYEQRRRAINALKAVAPSSIDAWKPLDTGREGALPIDDSDGGCDDQPQCRKRTPWQRQIAVIELAPADVVSDSGQEIFNTFQQRGIDNVMVLGVHTNMCVLGRPFGIRAMVGLGKNVVVVRDMTDTMYNSRRRPFVSHFAGTDLIVDHIEKHWCPSITTVDLLGGTPFRFAEDRRQTVARFIEETEHNGLEVLSAQSELRKLGLALDFGVAGAR